MLSVIDWQVNMGKFLAKEIFINLPILLQIRTVGKTMILIRPINNDKCSRTMAMHYMKYYLPSVIIKGINIFELIKRGVSKQFVEGLPSVSRCVIHADEKTGKSFKLLVEGTNFKEVLATSEINGNKTHFNNACVVAEVF